MFCNTQAQADRTSFQKWLSICFALWTAQSEPNKTILLMSPTIYFANCTQGAAVLIFRLRIQETFRPFMNFAPLYFVSSKIF